MRRAISEDGSASTFIEPQQRPRAVGELASFGESVTAAADERALCRGAVGQYRINSMSASGSRLRRMGDESNLSNR